MKSPCTFALSAVKHSTRVAAGLALFATLTVIAQAQPAATRAAAQPPANSAEATPAAHAATAAQPADATTAAAASGAAASGATAGADAKPDLARAQQIAGQVCSSCHG